MSRSAKRKSVAEFDPVDPLEWARRLIAIPSVNPAGDPGTPHTGEGRLVDFLARTFKRLGAEVRSDEVLPGRPNFIARFPLRGAVRRRVLFAPHSDTVSVAGMTIDPFEPLESEGKLYGRGASDTKGPMAAMCSALVQHTRRPEYHQGGLECSFAAFMGEETGCVGSTAFAATPEAKGFDLAIIAEPTDLKIVHAHKGCMWIDLRVPGRAAHASISRPSENAHFKLARILEVLRLEFLPWLAKRPHPVLGVTKLTPTVLRGGSKANIAPQDAAVTLDIRTVPGISVNALLAELRRVARSAIDGGRVIVDVSVAGAALDTNKDHPLLCAMRPATRGFTAAPWFCDAAQLAAIGVPSVALGPGSIRQAHTCDEFIRIADLRRGHQVYASVLERLGHSAPTD